MSHATISVWKPESVINTCSFLFRKEHEGEFKKHVKSQKLNPSRIFIVTPNAYHIEDLCLDYVAEITKTTRVTKSKAAVKIAEINQSFRTGEFSLAEELLEQLSSEWKETESTVSSFFEIKRKIISNLLRPLYWEPPFLLNHNFTDQKQWWRHTSSRITLISELKKELKNKFPGDGKEFLNYFEWLNAQELKLSKLRARTKNERYFALNEASAYLLIIAEHHLFSHRQSLAVLFLHRSADLLLMRACDENNLLDFTKEKPEFRTVPKGCKSKEIHFRSSHMALKQNGLTHNSSRENSFKKLNDLRNHLMYTHYFSSPDMELVKKIHEEVKGHLSLIGGKDWNDSINGYQPHPILSMQVIFGSHPILSSSVTEVKLEDI